MTTADASTFFVELVSQLFHSVLITEPAERIECLEAEVARLRAAGGDSDGAAP